MKSLAEKRAARSKAAYTLVDVSDLPTDVRQEIIEDATTGGKNYGVRVVEEVVNGAARAAIFGVYDADKETWEDAKREFGISGSEVDDGEVRPVAEADPNEEARLRQIAQERANEEADRIRTAELDEVRAIVGEDNVEEKPKAEGATVQHADRTTRASEPKKNKSPR